jgi:hypothetical protein
VSAWSPSLREEHRLKVFENRLLQRIFEEEKGSNKQMQKTTQLTASQFLLFTRYYYSDQITKD